jgi:hypothetical protein
MTYGAFRAKCLMPLIYTTIRRRMSDIAGSLRFDVARVFLGHADAKQRTRLVAGRKSGEQKSDKVRAPHAL